MHQLLLHFAPCNENPDSRILKIFACGIRNPGVLESGILLKESGIPLTNMIRNPCYTNKDWNPELTAWNLESNTVLDYLTRGDTFRDKFVYPVRPSN